MTWSFAERSRVQPSALTSSPSVESSRELILHGSGAHARGGLAAGAAFLERAAELTPEPVRRGERMLRAAEARLHAGAVADCRSLLARAVPLLEDPFARAMARRLKGFVLEAAGEPLAAITTLVQAATMLEPYDTRLSRATLLDAVTATWLSGSFSPVEDVLRAVCSSPTAEGADAPLADLLLEGFAAAWAQRYDEAVALLGRAMKPFTEGAPLSEEALRHSLSLVMAARMLYERSILHELEHRFADELRGRGALVALISTLVAVAFNQIEQGRFTAAEATIAEGRALSEATGFRAHLGEFDGAEMSLLAWRGREVEARALADRLLRDLTDQGHDLGRLQVHDALAQLDLGLGNYPAALRSARAGVPSRFETVAPINLVEAAMRSGEAEAARCALESFSAPALASATDFDLGMLARCEALLVDEGAEANFRLSVELLQRAGVTVEVARSQLLYGEWLRRQGRRRDAREQLHRAVEKFDELGMEAFGQRARAELRATGQHLQRQAVDQSAVLTPQESQIALLAAQGATNREIAAKLFISSATVDYHLRKVFRKLGVTTRVRLAPVLAEHERVTPQPC